ncbi:MAG: NAD(P)H-hydrate dehydratase, partial [Spirochaetales bacterium]
PAASIAALAALARGVVVALDLPSGIRAYDAPVAGLGMPVRADITLSVAPMKAELFFPGYRESAGRIEEIAGVFPVDEEIGVQLLEPDDLHSLLPPLSPDTHKGNRGALGVYGGAVGTLGAAILAARAGSAAGAGTVTLMVPDELYATAASVLSAQMVRPVSAGNGRSFDALVVGPGLGRDGRASSRVADSWATDLPLVLDADALRLIRAREVRSSGAPLVLTPHPGEFAPLAVLASGMDPEDSAALEEARLRCRFDTLMVSRLVARAFGAVVVLKGSTTWLAAPDGRAAVWDGRNPAMATGGSGDVLAGLLGGLLARGLDPWDAARAAVIAHGLAGAACAERLGFFDADALPEAAASIVYAGGEHGNQG